MRCVADGVAYLASLTDGHLSVHKGCHAYSPSHRDTVGQSYDILARNGVAAEGLALGSQNGSDRCHS